jgi:hypothetical protein
MSEGALEIMKDLAKAYVAGGYPNHRIWPFSVAQERDPIYNELVARRYIERHGAGTQNFILSQKGVDWIVEYTDSAGAGAAPAVATASAKPEFEAPLTDAEQQTVTEAMRQIEETLRDSHYPIGLTFSDERPIVQDEVHRRAIAAGWHVEPRGSSLKVVRTADR